MDLRALEQAASVEPSGPVGFDQFLESLPDAVLICASDGRMDFLNRQTETLTGYTHGELRGNPVEMLMPMATRQWHIGQREHYSKHPRTRGMGTHLDIKLRCKDGTEVPVDIALRPIETLGDPRIVVVVRDMRGWLLMQAKVKQAADLELARAKDELISLVSHEMRTPLGSIVGFTELLMTRDDSPSQRHRYLDIMLQEAKRLTGLINDFLDLQRLDGPHHKLNATTVDLFQLVKHAAASVPEDSKTPISISVPTDLPRITADSDAVLQVLSNLLSNARKYSPDGGEISLTARATEASVEVSVVDHGLGLQKEDLPYLFSKFYRTERPEMRKIGGTGLGLVICRRIVEAHGGRIEAISDGPNLGATFKFSLPIGFEAPFETDITAVDEKHSFGKLYGRHKEAD